MAIPVYYTLYFNISLTFKSFTHCFHFKLIVYVIRANYSFLCQPVDFSFDNPLEMEVSVVITSFIWLKNICFSQVSKCMTVSSQGSQPQFADHYRSMK